MKLMNLKYKLIQYVLMLSATAAVAQSGITTNQYSLSPNAAIPDGSPVGLIEHFSATGLTGSITNVTVQLDITGGFNGDLYAYLVNPQGQLSVLLNRVGVTGSSAFGYSDAGLNITLDGLATSNIHSYASGGPGSYSLSGTTWAADGRNIDPQSVSSVFDTASTAANLSLFQNTAPNGEWTFFIADLSGGGGTATLNSLVLSIMTVPEPQTWFLLSGGVSVLWLVRNRRDNRASFKIEQTRYAVGQWAAFSERPKRVNRFGDSSE